MKTIFGIALLTVKEVNAVYSRIEAVERATEKNEQRVAKLGCRLTEFAGKFYTAMDFISRNLPLKRKRKAIRKIVDA